MDRHLTMRRYDVILFVLSFGLCFAGLGNALPFSEAQTAVAVSAARATFEAVQNYHLQLEDQFASK